jgi:hypothetical protein
MHYPGMRSLWQSPANFRQHLAFPTPFSGPPTCFVCPLLLHLSLIFSLPAKTLIPYACVYFKDCDRNRFLKRKRGGSMGGQKLKKALAMVLLIHYITRPLFQCIFVFIFFITFICWWSALRKSLRGTCSPLLSASRVENLDSNHFYKDKAQWIQLMKGVYQEYFRADTQWIKN